jgi:hypothetical protein
MRGRARREHVAAEDRAKQGRDEEETAESSHGSTLLWCLRRKSEEARPTAVRYGSQYSRRCKWLAEKVSGCLASKEALGEGGNEGDLDQQADDGFAGCERRLRVAGLEGGGGEVASMTGRYSLTST